MAKNIVVFIRGGKVSPDRPWKFFHFHPMKELNVGAVDLVYFDFPNGVQSTLKNWTPKRSNEAPKRFVNTPLKPVVKIRLEDMTLGKERPSILALYEWVKKQKKGSIISLQFFSHGYYEGPIIWKYCWERSDEEDITADRDIHDTEPRNRDFFGKNPLAGIEGKKFAQAFHINAFVKLWGCNRNDPLRKMVSNYLNAPKDIRGDDVRKEKLSLYLDTMKLSFQYNLALKLNIPSWVAPYGWGSDGYDKEIIPNKNGKERRVKYTGKFPPNLNKEHWWRVSAYFREQKKYLNFYKITLKSEMDATFFFRINKLWIENIIKKVS